MLVGIKGINFHHDNACPLTALRMKDLFEKNGWESAVNIFMYLLLLNERDTATRVQILDEAVYIPYSTPRNIYNPTYLLLAISIDTNIWMHFLDANKTAGEKARQQLHKNAASNIEQVLEATSHKALTIQPPTSHHENYQT